MLSGPETEKWGHLQHQGKGTQIPISGRKVSVRRILYHLSLQGSHRVTLKNAFVPGASVRNSARGKGHEEGGLAYAKA